MSHTMKVWEVMDKRIRGKTSVGEKQFGLLLAKETTDVVFVLRQMMEKFKCRRNFHNIHKTEEGIQ